MLNSVSLTGRLTKDVDLRYTQSGTAVGSFTIAVDRQFRSTNGERETDFINCVIWRKSAENFANFTHKGSLVGIEGHIQTRTYDNAQGQKVFVTEVIVENFALLEPRQTSQDSQQRSANNPAAASQGNRFANNGQPIDVSDDDLPF
ncbi:Helix-destabilizing protein [Lacticaseibacillus paracasei]|uniref:single-stranded DNA-binding protein n=1 Tax=Lacticaseibacillus paracasei TaxID=1597 RepID=UPI000FED1176|nr:single-stranded DNA-binding protein [Lacticaseibacillus paracasei]RNE23526.1 Helix-destabilizing protein [Lacticaseibacillus paracasei]